MTLLELFEIYSRKRLKTCSPHTLRLYRHSIKAFSATLGKTAEIADLTDDNLEDHMHRIVRSGLSIASANKDYAQISAIWRFAHRNGFTTVWPNVKPFHEPEKVPLGWLTHEVDQLFNTIDRLDYKISSVPARLWWRVLLSILLDTGERIGAIRQLTRANVHGDYIVVPAEIRKRQTREKLYKLSPRTATDLSTLLALHRYDLIFPWDRSETYIYYRYTAILKSAGLASCGKSKFHRIRRTVASAVANQGGNATTAMDHANARTTTRYLDPRIVGGTSTATLVRDWLDGKRVK
jgi:integrase